MCVRGYKQHEIVQDGILVVLGLKTGKTEILLLGLFNLVHFQ